jgi:hypothetical protein
MVKAAGATSVASARQVLVSADCSMLSRESQRGGDTARVAPASEGPGQPGALV